MSSLNYKEQSVRIIIMGFIVSKLFPKDKEVKIVMIGGMSRAEQLRQDEHTVPTEPGRGDTNSAE